MVIFLIEDTGVFITMGPFLQIYAIGLRLNVHVVRQLMAESLSRGHPFRLSLVFLKAINFQGAVIRGQAKFKFRIDRSLQKRHRSPQNRPVSSEKTGLLRIDRSLCDAR